MTEQIHSCSYYCDRSECIKSQRNDLREENNTLRQQVAKLELAIKESEADVVMFNTKLYAYEKEWNAMVKDAELYRWLRSHSHILPGGWMEFGPGVEQSDPYQIDATINAAMNGKP